MAFHYLRREVPPGYEHTFKVYYSPDDGASWERLPTDLYPGQNLATVAANESGIYALAAAVDIPLYNQGWNLFSFPAPYTLTVSSALQSLPADSYGTIFAYDSEDLADPWKVYDPTPGREWMNELSHLAFGESYWISITKAITDPPLLPCRSRLPKDSPKPSARARYQRWLHRSSSARRRLSTSARCATRRPVWPQTRASMPWLTA